ncbi:MULTISPECIES: helix-turn-helix domain-containing protein [Providencia]|uniref:helix-turn-helix domain-containing protein n=2 Tax=Morganellaceae TaxID=1903414 RepID=UPI0001C34A10|nr:MULTISPECIES: helix-turn-helix domain-containing protein [Providencia]MBI6189344.1 helix-turn-helix domain-containing protein [Providencia rettgeri]QKG44340.1 helix-turn-helix domain-containing protein [Providencia rettgeri]QNN34472.1 helix-turn-helix domain-containing protein [Providencia rettgeri]QXA59377.1 helix-turn-helix domain-containing protein [Providencia rettgeri]BBV03687.1 transposase [Providencia rettgeri]
MSKYSRDLKIIIANQCLAGEASRKLSKIYSIPSRQIRYWAQVVAIHGNNAFQPTPHLRCANARFQALKLMWTNDWSLGHTSAILNLTTPGILSIWLDRYNENGFKGLECGPRGRPSMKHPRITPVRSDDEKTLEELKEELAYLRAENAVLKKLEELEQIKRRQAKKKR